MEKQHVSKGARRDTGVYNLTEGARGEMKTPNVYDNYPQATADLTQYNKWSDENKDNPMEAFTYFTHCTDDDFKGLAKLEPRTAKSPWGGPLSEEGAPGGVWFAMGLYKGGLPTISPYGENRLLMPWQKLIKSLTVVNRPPLLFLESIQFRDRERKRNVRLMLVKHDDTGKIKWCVDNHLPCLDLFKNPFMELAQTQHTMMTHRNDTNVATWVVLLVPYTVDINGCTFQLKAVDKKFSMKR